MSVNEASAETESSVPTTTSPAPLKTASYMGCRYCEEGSLVYDSEAGASRCRTCGKLD